MIETATLWLTYLVVLPLALAFLAVGLISLGLWAVLCACDALVRHYEGCQ